MTPAETHLVAAVRANAPAPVSVMARCGYAARGVVYFLIGASAAIATVRPEHRPGGMTDALTHLQRHGYGFLVLIPLAIGLVCLAGWFATAAFRRRDHTGIKRAMLRAGMLGDAAVYAGFTVIVLGLTLGWWQGSGDRGFQAWTAWLLGQAYGRWLVGAIGAGVAGGGIGLVIWAVTGNVERNFDLPQDQQNAVRPIARYGLAGRGIAIALIGIYLIAAAVHANPREAHELGGLLTALRATHYGQAAILFFALAFLGSGMFDFLSAIYRRFDPAHP